MNLKLKVLCCILATVLLTGLALPSAQPVYAQAEGDQTLLSGSLSTHTAAGSNDAAPTGYFAASFPGFGFYTYSFVSGTWTKISPLIPENFVYAGTILYGDFGASGIYYWTGSVWTQIATANPENMILMDNYWLVGDFGSSGIWLYTGTGMTWIQLATANPENMVYSPAAGLLGDFGASGIWLYIGQLAWTNVATANPLRMAISN